jgi:DNA-binding CsgD family transcriptional regulator
MHGQANAIDRLTDRQRECLRLVHQHLTSKDIARRLGISPHTVDMRLRTAIRLLNVQNRTQAALLLANAEAAATYHRDVYQTLTLDTPRQPEERPHIVVSEGVEQSDRTGCSSNGPGTDAVGSTVISFGHVRTDTNAADDDYLLRGWDAGELRDDEEHGDGDRIGGNNTRALNWWPVPLQRHQQNTLNPLQKLFWILMIALMSSLLFGSVITTIANIGSLLGYF